jgi:hypothetical protein
VDAHHDQNHRHQDADGQDRTAHQELALSGWRAPRAAAATCPLSRGSTKPGFFYFVEERHE